MINKIVFDDNSQKKYRTILKFKIDDESYIIYTKDEVNKLGDIICYVGNYEYKMGKQVLKPVNDKMLLEVIDEVFIKVQSLINKKESGKYEK